MTETSDTIFSATAVAVGDRALAIEGPPGSGKSSLALALIDRGALLIGDDAVKLSRSGDHLLASPPPNIEGLLELRGIGLFDFPLSRPRPLCLIVSIGVGGERLPENIPQREILGVKVPCIPFYPGSITPALRAEMALDKHGLELFKDHTGK